MTGEIASTPPSIEFVRPPDLRECIEHAHKIYDTSLWASLGENIEERYLPDEFYRDEEDPTFFTLSSVSEAMFDPKVVGENVGALSEEQLAELRQSSKTIGEAWASATVSRGASCNVAEEIPLEPGPNPESNWRICPADDGSPLLIATLQGRTFSVRLDDLYAREPETVRANILEFHQTKLLENLGLYLRQVARYHEASADEIMPDFVRQLAALPPHERAEAQYEILTLMKLFAQHDYRLGTQFNKFKDRLLYRGEQRADDIVAHMATCPTQPEDIRQGSASLNDFYSSMKQINYQEQPLGELTEAQQDYLRKADLYLPGHAAERSGYARKPAEETKAFADFIISMHETSDPEAFLSALQETFPDLFQRFHQFKEAVQGHTLSGYTFESMTKEAVSKASIIYRGLKPKTQLEEFEDCLNMGTLWGKYLPEGMSRAGRYGPVKIQDEKLRSVVSILLSKHAQADIKARSASEGISASGQEQIQKCKATEMELVAKYQERAATSLKAAERHIEEGHAADAARRSLELSDEDNSWLAQIWDSENYRNPLDAALFNVVLYTLLAERQGIIQDSTSPIVKGFIHEFLKDLHGQLSPRREQKLQELGLL